MILDTDKIGVTIFKILTIEFVILIVVFILLKIL